MREEEEGADAEEKGDRGGKGEKGGGGGHGVDERVRVAEQGDESAGADTTRRTERYRRETYTSGNRDLYKREKRPIKVGKETYTSGKRDLAYLTTDARSGTGESPATQAALPVRTHVDDRIERTRRGERTRQTRLVSLIQTAKAAGKLHYVTVTAPLRRAVRAPWTLGLRPCHPTPPARAPQHMHSNRLDNRIVDVPLTCACCRPYYGNPGAL